MALEVSKFDYDVFLSFRGPDTRQGFADVLYKGMDMAEIRVFRDDRELEVGDRIDTILEAVNNSQLCVPIFSETFASSKWCLLEVTRMVHLDKTIVPIFYKVSSDDVKLKNPKYLKSMAEHETKYAKEEVEEWKGALKAAAQCMGRELLNKSYTEFCDEFIREVLKKLGPRPKFKVDDLVGVEKQLERLQELLDLNSADVRYIGIHGMGGIGKTSLVKDFFNRLSARFNLCRFIENVREKSMDVNGLGKLEKGLRRKLGLTFDTKEVLLVLDDVDKSEQIEKLVGKSSRFGPGSRIVVTTRDKSVLEKCKALKAEEVFLFEMEVLETRDALRLFSRCAFRKDSPPLDFEILSQEAVSTTGNLPLALEVMGPHLRNEKREVWEDTIARSKVVPMKDVKDRLKISYDKLEKDEQQIFLDIACILKGDKISEAMSMWKACKFYPNQGLAVLKSRSLIKVWGNDHIRLHDLLRDLGRDIVRGESDFPHERSRLWERDEAQEVLKSKKGKENVQALYLNHYSNNITLKREHLEKFENLRLLCMGGAKLEGEMDNILPKLRWLRWRAPAELEASNFRLPNLVTLNLSDSDIGDDWGGWRLLQGAKNLKDLILWRCLKLTRTPDFAEHMNIERLDLNDCENLVMVRDSIDKLKCLKHLELRGTKVVRLPESVGALESLVYLNLSRSGIAELPDSICSFTKLERLDLTCCSVLKALPPSIGNIKSLIELHLTRTAIEALPNSIGSLENLKVLDVTKCRLRGLPKGIGELGKLEELCAGSNLSLEELPSEIMSLSCLRVLDVCKSKIHAVPSSISQLSLLQFLNLEECPRIQEIPELPTSLRELYVGSEVLKKIPDTSRLNNLESSGLLLGKDAVTSNFDAIESLSKFQSLRFPLGLPDDTSLLANFSRLSQLQFLDLSCQNLKNPLQLPSSLRSLHLRHVNSETKLCLSYLVNLTYLRLEECSQNDGYESLGIGRLLSLDTLTVVRCNMVEGLRLLQNVRRVDILN